MSQDQDGKVVTAAEGAAQGETPKLRSHVTVIRQITYEGDAEHVEGHLRSWALEDGLYVGPQGTFTIRVQTAQPDLQEPQWLVEARNAKTAAIQEAVQKAQREASAGLVNPHTGRPFPRKVN